MKHMIMAMVIVLAMVAGATCPAHAGTSDRGLVKSYVEKHYGMPVKWVSEGSGKVKHRKGKPYVVVEKLNTTCTGGKHGKTKGGYHTKYNKSDRKGHKVTQYLVYNPRTNAIDDVVAVVDHKRLR